MMYGLNRYTAAVTLVIQYEFIEYICSYNLNT